MIGEGITREAIERAQREVRATPEAVRRSARMEARMAESARRVQEIRRDLETKTRAGDPRATRLLRELYPDSEALPRAEVAARKQAFLSVLEARAEREPGAEG